MEIQLGYIHRLSNYHKTQLLDYVMIQIRHPKIDPIMYTKIINSTNANKKQKIDVSSTLTIAVIKVENIFDSRESAIPNIEKQYNRVKKFLYSQHYSHQLSTTPSVKTTM